MLEPCEPPVPETKQSSFEGTMPPVFTLDSEKLAEDVQSIVHGEYFQNLLRRVKELRERDNL